MNVSFTVFLSKPTEECLLAISVLIFVLQIVNIDLLCCYLLNKNNVFMD